MLKRYAPFNDLMLATKGKDIQPVKTLLQQFRKAHLQVTRPHVE